MWCELDLNGASSNRGKLLIELAEVPVRSTKCIGMIALAQLCVQQVFLERTTRARDGRLEIKNDVIQINEIMRTQSTTAVRALQAAPTVRAAMPASDSMLAK